MWPLQVTPVLSPTTSLGSSASRHQLLGQALRLSSLRESSPSPVTAADSLTIWPAGKQITTVCATHETTPTGPAALLGGLDGTAAADDAMPDSVVWETVFLPPTTPKEPWHPFETGQMFAGEDELDAHAAAVLTAENDAMVDAMEHAAAAVPLPPAVGGSGSASSPPPAIFVPLDPAQAEPTLLGAPSPVIVVRRADSRPDLAGVTTAKAREPSPAAVVSGGQYWGSPLLRIPRCVPDSSLDSFETATGYDPPEMPGQGDWSADEGDVSEASAPQTPRGNCDDSDGLGGYGSEDEWTPACVRRAARRSRTSSTGGAAVRGAGSQSNSPTHRAGSLHLAAGVEQPGRAAAARVRDVVRAFGCDADEEDPAGSPPRPSARRGAGGKRRRSPAGVADSHDSDGNPRHKRHNPWCDSQYSIFHMM